MVVILEGNGLITQGKEGRKEGSRCMPCRGLITHFAAAFAPFLHYLTSSSSSSGNVRREKLERTAGTASTAMQKGEEPISEPNWAAKRPFVRSLFRSVPSRWKCGSSCFQTRMGIGEEGGDLQRDQSDHHNHQPTSSPP